MKIGSCLYRNERYVYIDAEHEVLLPALDDKTKLPFWRDILALIEQGASLPVLLNSVCAQATDAIRIPKAEVVQLAPIPRPRKNVMCLGLNYYAHVEETSGHFSRDGKKPRYPIVFTKANSSVIGHEQGVLWQAESCSQLDWEAELAVIIGKGGRHITRDNAMSHVFGYTIINDLSARDLQFNHKQFFLGKSIDGGCPMGPHIVTADEIPNPHQLNIRCRVNDELKQDSNTRHMIFDIPDIIEHLSRGMTLEAGDVIATGTPSGVGFVRNPPEFLRPGDTVECEIEGIGVLRNYFYVSPEK